MAELLIDENQFTLIRSKLEEQSKFEMAKREFHKLTEEEKQFVLYFTGNQQLKNSKLLKEDWINNVLSVVGIIDPTPITDTVLAIRYFKSGDILFGVLSLIAALPGYVGDIVAKPVMAALKIGGGSTKLLDDALKMAKSGNPAQVKQAENIISTLAARPDVIGSFLQKSVGPNGWANKMLKYLDLFPNKVFGGLKRTIQDYFTLLTRAASKSSKFHTQAGMVAKNWKKSANHAKEIENLKSFLVNEKVLDISQLNKPGILTQIFSGGVPRILRSDEGRRMRILMQNTKFYAGFLDSIGLGNWVGPEEVEKLLGGQKETDAAMEKYAKSEEGKKNLEDEFGEGEVKEKKPEGLTAGKLFKDFFGGGTKSSSSAGSDPLLNMFSIF